MVRERYDSTLATNRGDAVATTLMGAAAAPPSAAIAAPNKSLDVRRLERKVNGG